MIPEYKALSTFRYSLKTRQNNNKELYPLEVPNRSSKVEAVEGTCRVDDGKISMVPDVS